MRGGIESDTGLRPEPWTILPQDPPLDRYVPSRTNDELSNSSQRRQTARNGYVVAQFSFFGSNVSPFFQILSAIAAILRASVRRAISVRMPVCFNLSVYVR